MSEPRTTALRLVDYHCHLDLYPDHLALIAECQRLGVATLAVTTTPKAFARNRQMASTSPAVRVALGLHPQLVAEREAEIDLFEQLLPQTRFVGEVGLDAGPRHYASFVAQERVFVRVLRSCAAAGGKIISIHSVRAAGKVLDCLEQHLPPSRGIPVLHWFTGSATEARRAAAMGCYFSVNVEMLTAPHHKRTIQALPVNRIVTETDGPFIQLNRKPIRPIDVGGCIDRLAEIVGLSSEATAKKLIANLATLESQI